MRPSILWSLLVVSFAAAPLAHESGAQQTPPFRAEAELVTVDVVVVDRRGEPVADLTTADFVVTEEGRVQTVQFFQQVPSGEQTRGTGAAKSATRAYRYSTNVGAEARPGRSFVVFFDDVHLTRELGETAKKAIERFLTEETQDGDLVSLVAPARALRWHARLPDGRADLVKVLESLGGEHNAEIGPERISDYEAYRIHVLHDEQTAERVGRRFSNLRVAGREPVDLQTDKGPRPETKGGTAGLIEPIVLARAAEAYSQASARLRATLGALTETIESMSSVRGRKSIVVMSPGFILDQDVVLFRQVEDAARRANIALYFVDARGLQVQSAFASAQFGSPIDSRDIGAANADLSLEAEGAVSLAEVSGGFAVQNRNDLAAGLRRIARESQVYYLLGYRPAERQSDAKFRRIGVKVNRPDVQVRARKGYYPGGITPATKGIKEVDGLEAALGSPYDLAGIPVRAASYVFGSVNASESAVMLAVESDLRAFELKPNNGSHGDVLEVRLLVTDPATGQAKRHERTVEMTLPNGVPRSETSAWYPVSQSFELAPGRYQARVAVRDRNSGRTGSVTHDFEVPARKGMTLSSVIVTDTIEIATQPTAEAPKPVLMVRRLVPAGATLYYQYSIYDAGQRATGEPQVKAGHIIRRLDGTSVKKLDPTPVKPGAAGLRRFAGISLTGIPAGDYELIIDVVDEVRGEAVQVVEPFAIAEPERPE
jgi:VWFA-related protein